eukprot:4515542-Prymnesium_polylepis.2
MFRVCCAHGFNALPAASRGASHAVFTYETLAAAAPTCAAWTRSDSVARNPKHRRADTTHRQPRPGYRYTC